MTKKLVWRLREQPSTQSLRDLVKDGIITKDEAREILMANEELMSKEEHDKKQDVEALKSEIKFLREMVDKLTQNRVERIIEVVKEFERPYYRYDWYKPYITWCAAASNSIMQYKTATALDECTVKNLCTNDLKLTSFTNLN